MNKTYLTQEGYQQLKEQLSVLTVKRDRLVNQIEEVAQPDESGEDGLATQLKDELEVVYAKIENIEQTLEVTQVMTGQPKNTGMVQVGSLVKIKISGDSIKEFSIVNHMESDPSLNKISDQSPLGLALLGKKLHDEIEVTAPVGKISYKIVSID